MAFFYVNYYRTHKTRHSKDIAVFDMVRSNYRAGWVGQVTNLNPDNGVATVVAMYDKRGNKLRKHIVKELHVHWLDVINDEYDEWGEKREL